MYLHLILFDKMIWVSIKDGLFIPKSTIEGFETIKLPNDWIDEETRKASYDLKAKYILISALSGSVYYSILHCEITQSMWNALQILNAGTDDVKQSNINILIEEYDLFRMELTEIVESMKIHFIHLINILHNLGKTLSKQYCANKMLRFMC